MASKILHVHVDNYNTKRKTAEFGPEAPDESRKRVKQDLGSSCQTVTKSKADLPRLGVFTSWKEPSLLPVSDSCKASIVFFDLETTSLKLDCDITQISAIHDEDVFNKYVVPRKTIHPMASKITGLTCYDGVMYLHSQPVEALPQKVALENFLAWIKERSPVLMFAHNAIFDYTRLFHALESHGLHDQFSCHIEGFVDTLQLFRAKFPRMLNYKQETLAKKILKKKYSCHNSVEDVKILQELYFKSDLQPPHSFHGYSCTFISAFNRWFYTRRAGRNKNTFSNMIKDGTLTKDVATDLAYSGLCRRDLQIICQKAGETKLLELLNETDTSGQPRISEAEKHVGKIVQHFEKNSKANAAKSAGK